MVVVEVRQDMAAVRSLGLVLCVVYVHGEHTVLIPLSSERAYQVLLPLVPLFGGGGGACLWGGADAER